MDKIHKTNHNQELQLTSNVNHKKYDSIFNYTIKIIYLKKYIITNQKKILII